MRGVCVAAVLSVVSVAANDIFVSPAGDDAHAGTS
jgi:hypothetical protein|eukprot:COSAG03_NODE_9_length_23924_cov_40.675690_22_plen_35_part_00